MEEKISFWIIIAICIATIIIARIAVWFFNNYMWCPRCKKFVYWVDWHTSDSPLYKGTGHGGRKCPHCNYKTYDYSNIPSD